MAAGRRAAGNGAPGAEVGRALGSLKETAAGEANLMPYFLDAARARTSEGEMVAALQDVFGRDVEQPVF